MISRFVLNKIIKMRGTPVCALYFHFKLLFYFEVINPINVQLHFHKFDLRMYIYILYLYSGLVVKEVGLGLQDFMFESNSSIIFYDGILGPHRE